MNTKLATMTDADRDQLLQAAGLRLTRQRQALAAILFDGTHKHLSAEQIHTATRKKHISISLATVYNTLHQFTKAGLLREINIDSAHVYFDTNTEQHHHFFHEDVGTLMDIPASSVDITRLPKPPQGMEIGRVDVILRVRSSS
jgi:Fur family iron response transcriptional regulator